MRALIAAGALLALTAMPAQAEPARCELVFQYGGWEVQDQLPEGFYYLYVRDHGWTPLLLGYSNGSIRFLLGDVTYSGYQIRTEGGEVVSRC